MIVDAGFLIALERGDRNATRVLAQALDEGLLVLVPSTVEAQVVRDLATQVRLARALDGMVSVPLDRQTARAVGNLLARAATTDVVDAHVAIVASRHPGPVVTSDPDDLAALGIHPDRLLPV